MNVVELVSATPEAEKTMAFIARVSNPNNQDNKNFSGLLKYCIDHEHWSVFEQAYMTIQIETNRGIAAQILRHRSFTFQEFSQRYADPTKELEFVTREARMQDPKNRQNSIPLDKDDTINYIWESYQEVVIERCLQAYEWAIEAGIAKEQARAVLPEGLTLSRLYVNGTLRSWIHYIELRRAHGTQEEHSLIAKECAKVISEIFPYNEIL